MTKTLILSKAFEFFAAKGYEATSMEDIAQAVGIKKPSLYAHFPSKERIFQQVFEDMLSDYSSYIDALIQSAPQENIEERLYSIFVNYAEYFANQTKQNFWTRSYLFPPEFMKEEILQKSMMADLTFMEKLGGIFIEGIETGQLYKGNPEDMVTAFYLMLSGNAMWASFDQNGSIKERLSGCWQVFWRGIKS